MPLHRERPRLFGNRRRSNRSSPLLNYKTSTSSSAASSAVSSIQFTRLNDHYTDTSPVIIMDDEATSSSTSLLLLDKMKTSEITPLDKENSSYDFRSIMSTSDDDEPEVLFAHMTDRTIDNRDDDDEHISKAPAAVAALVTPPRLAVVATTDDNSDLDQDMAKAFALVGLVLDSYPELRQQYLARYQNSNSNEDNTKNGGDGQQQPQKSLAMTAMTSAGSTAASAAPPTQVWMLLAVLLGVLFALDGLVARAVSLWMAYHNKSNSDTAVEVIDSALAV